MQDTIHTIYAPGAWCEDIESAMESWAIDLEKNPLCATGTHSGIAEVLAQYEDGSRLVRRGKGYAHRFDLTIEGIKSLRAEAFYRWEFNGGNDNPYGASEPNYSAKHASKVLMDRCDVILTAVTA
jgi:hypothetical protein